MHHTLGGQIPDFEKVLKSALGDDGGDPVACVDCFGGMVKRESLIERKILPV